MRFSKSLVFNIVSLAIMDFNIHANTASMDLKRECEKDYKYLAYITAHAVIQQEIFSLFLTLILACLSF